MSRRLEQKKVDDASMSPKEAEKPVVKKTIHYVGIIGSAGRNADETKLTSPLLWKRMLASAKSVLSSVWRLEIDQIVLVSGGSAWADHVTIALFCDQQEDAKEGYPEFAGLELFLPAPLIPMSKSLSLASTAKSSSSSAPFDSSYRTGRRLNDLHNSFATVSGRPTSRDWDSIKTTASKHGKNGSGSVRLTVVTGDNFFRRNDRLAERCTHLLAFPSDPSFESAMFGGTMYTWKACGTTVDRVYVPWSWLLDSDHKTSYVRPFQSPTKNEEYVVGKKRNRPPNETGTEQSEVFPNKSNYRTTFRNRNRIQKRKDILDPAQSRFSAILAASKSTAQNNPSPVSKSNETIVRSVQYPTARQ